MDLNTCVDYIIDKYIEEIAKKNGLSGMDLRNLEYHVIENEDPYTKHKMLVFSLDNHEIARISFILGGV